MCGICGVVDFSGDASALVRRMTPAMVHRGPDDEGYLDAGPVALGMRRLSIIDLAGGQQPIYNEDETIGAVLNGDAFVLRYFSDDGDDRLLCVNLGRTLHLDPAPEPLLAPPQGMRWQILWSSEDPRYGGHGTPALETEDNWYLPGQAAVVLAAAPGRPL